MARLPTIKQSIYTKNFLDIHFGVRPDLRKSNLDVDILKRGMEYMSDKGINHFRATLSDLDESTIKVYESAGFFIDKKVLGENGKDTFLIMTTIWEED